MSTADDVQWFRSLVTPPTLREQTQSLLASMDAADKAGLPIDAWLASLSPQERLMFEWLRGPGVNN